MISERDWSRHGSVAALTGHIKGPPERDTLITPESNSMLDLAGPPANTMNVMAEYWIRENAARRIFAIAMVCYQGRGMDKAEIAGKAISMITRGHGDVRAMVQLRFSAACAGHETDGSGCSGVVQEWQRTR